MAPASRDLLSQLCVFSRNPGQPRGASFIAWIAAGLSLVCPTPAQAQEDGVKACAEAYEQAQVARNSGKLRESEEQLRICVRDVCPDFVKVDCGQWLSDVRREMPSVILVVTDGKGNELTDVQVTMDGALLASATDGKAFEVNPGPHELTFEREGVKRSERVSIRQGEKNRVIKIELASHVDSDSDGLEDIDDRCPTEVGDASSGGCPVVAPKVVESKPLSGLQIGAIAAGGVGVLGFGTFAIFGLKARSIADDGLAACTDSDKCSETEADEWKQDEEDAIVLANVGVIVGGVGVATAAVLFAVSLDGNSEDPQARRLDLNLTPTTGGALFGARGSF